MIGTTITPYYSTAANLPGGPLANKPPERPTLSRMKGEALSGGRSISGYGFSTLSHQFDDALKQWGPSLYEWMLTDPAIHACVETLKKAVVSQGFKVSPDAEYQAEPGDEEKESDPNVKQAAEIAAFVNWSLQRLDRSFIDTVYEYLDALSFGCKLGELVWEDAMTPEGLGGEGAGSRSVLTLKSIKIKPRQSWAFVVDPYMNVVGILAAIVTTADGQTPGPGTIGAARGYGYEVISPEKFAWFSWWMKDGDPRGRSLLRAAYAPWLDKGKQLPARFVYNARFGQPRIVFVEGPDAPPFYNADGTLTTYGAAMKAMADGFDAGTWAIIPNGGDAKVVQPMGNGNQYATSIADDNREMAFAVLQNTRTIMEAQFGSKADSGTGKDVTDLVASAIRTSVESFVEDQIAYKLVEANYGKDVADRFAPSVSFGGDAVEDFSKNAPGVAALFNAGYLDSQHLPQTDKRLGLKPVVRDIPEPVAPLAPGEVPGDSDKPPGDRQEKSSRPPKAA